MPASSVPPGKSYQPYPPMPPSPLQRIQTPVPRVPAVFQPVPVQPYHLRVNPGAMQTLDLQTVNR